MATPYKISTARINKLYNLIDKNLEDFLTKNPKTSNEEVHVALWRIYQVRELQPIIQLTNQWQADVSREDAQAKADYIK